MFLTSIRIKWKQPEDDISCITGVIEKRKSCLHIILLILDIVSPGILVVCGDSIPLINVWIPNFTYILLYNAYFFMS